MELNPDTRQVLIKGVFILATMLALSTIITFGLAIALSINTSNYGALMSKKTIHFVVAFTWIHSILNVATNLVGVSYHWTVMNLSEIDNSKDDDQEKTLNKLKPWQTASLVTTVWDILLVLICVSVWLSSTVQSHFEEGILIGIKSYGINNEMREELNKLQINFRCCGSRSYNDWFKVDWSSNSNSHVQKDDVPWSCCDPRVFRPCIHFGVHKNASNYNHAKDLTLYRLGCASKIAGETHFTVLIINLVLAPIALMQLTATVCSRLAGSALQEAFRRGDLETPTEAWICQKSRGKNNNHSHRSKSRGSQRKNADSFTNYKYTSL